MMEGMKDVISRQVIVTEDLTKTYSANDVPVYALRGINLTITAGEFTAIVGPSGSGKTTFLNIISGLDQPTEGKVWLSEELLSNMNGRQLSDFRRDNIGFIFQAYNLIPVLTVGENIEYIMLLQGIPKLERHQRVVDILEVVGLTGYIDRKPPQLSGGQQQRVAIARAMVSQPKIILADEPTANLDAENSHHILQTMLKLNQNLKTTFIFATHDDKVIQYLRRKIRLDDGQVVGDETITNH